MVETCLFLDLGVLRSLKAWPDLEHPSQSGSSSDMSTKSSDCIFVTLFLGIRGSLAPMNRAELLSLPCCWCCSGREVMDLPMTAKWHNCSCGGMHLSSIKKVKRDSSICYVNENIEKGGWGNYECINIIDLLIIFIACVSYISLLLVSSID